MSPKKKDPLSGEFDKEISSIPGAPFIHHTPPPPKLQKGMTERQQRHALRKMKYNEKRADEGLVSAQVQIDKIQKNNEEGRVFASPEDTLQKIAVKFLDRHPTDIEIKQVSSFIRIKVHGKLEMSLDDAIRGIFNLSNNKHTQGQFAELKAEFLAQIE